jgi:N-methylhydantoinase B
LTEPRILDRIDPITFEVLRNSFIALVDEMGLMLEKVAFSLVVSEGRDFSTSICDRDANLVADGTQDLPGHIGTMPFTTRGIIDAIGYERLRQGDIILMNDAFIGGTHSQDARTVMPVYWEGELIAFVQSSAHWADAGGAVPGSFQVDALSTYEEALYITPIHLVDEGVLNEELLAFVLRNVRIPEVTRGDIVAMIEACKTGEARLHALLVKYGKDLILRQMTELIAHSERLIRGRFRQLKDGTYSFTDYIDYDPGSQERTPLPVHLDLTIEGDRAIYDFAKTAPQAKGSVNATRSLLWSAVMVATKAVFPEVPVNQGIFHAIEVVAPDGLVITANFPAPVSGAFATVYEKITSCVFGCFLQVIPERAMAGSGNICNMVLGGVDTRPGREGRDYVMYNWLEGGYGARPGKKDNHTAMSLFASGTRNQPIEMLERAYPVLFDRYGLIPDSAGPGRHRGGLGVWKYFWITHGDAILSVLGDRELRPAWGYGGGKSANKGNQMIYKAETDSPEVIGMKRSGIPVKSGHLFHYWQGGGGGYGVPWERPPEWVLDDVIDGYISVEGARDDYYAVIEVGDAEALEYSINYESTNDLRAAARREGADKRPQTAEAENGGAG